MSVGIVVFAHGSRVESANEAVRRVAVDLARNGGFDHVEPAFLELGEPNLQGAVGRLAAQGVDRIIIAPYFLTLGMHMERDLPKLVEDICRNYKGLEVIVTDTLDKHPALVQILKDRVSAVLP